MITNHNAQVVNPHFAFPPPSTRECQNCVSHDRALSVKKDGIGNKNSLSEKRTKLKTRLTKIILFLSPTNDQNRIKSCVCILGVLGSNYIVRLWYVKSDGNLMMCL